MSLSGEYVKLKGEALNVELRKQIGRYNKKQDTFLVVYAAAMYKPSPSPELNGEDYKIFCDIIRDVDEPSLDMYVETPGGSGEAAEELVRYMRDKFDRVSFVVAGEAKSAGTILVLSGDEILMTDTGSLGPIDAQMQIGRSKVSAVDYVRSMNEMMEEAKNTGVLYPVQATMVAQVSPGEFENVYNALEFAKERVRDWLPKYKYRDWNVTETKKTPVTEEMKVKRAAEIADILTDTGTWRTHARSIKRTDLEEIGLRIQRVEDDAELADIVYRIQMLLTVILSSTPVFKIISTTENTVNRQAAPNIGQMMMPVQQPDIAEVDLKCENCGTVHKFYLKFVNNPQIDKDMHNAGRKKMPANKMSCTCGTELNTKAIREQMEHQFNRKSC